MELQDERTVTCPWCLELARAAEVLPADEFAYAVPYVLECAACSAKIHAPCAREARGRCPACGREWKRRRQTRSAQVRTPGPEVREIERHWRVETRTNLGPWAPACATALALAFLVLAGAIASVAGAYTGVW